MAPLEAAVITNVVMTVKVARDAAVVVTAVAATT
jgi:hypothetical protein